MYVQTPRSDVYVALLGVALAAMVIGCILLAMVLQRYEFKTKAVFVPSQQAVPTALAANTGNISSIRL